ncbi:MAG: hypothetical protein IJJ82_06655 [Clostridia bacterium]|nr:hypothetical protein [Clostridia bacterium]
MEINAFNLLACFIVYSFLGWIMESIFRSFCEKKIINTGFLIGPMCPIYGVGSIIMITCMGWLQGRIIELFIISVVILTFWEYIVGVFLEKVFQTKYWDYSDHKFNFQGRICLTNSILWGCLGVGFINIIHPFVWGVISGFDQNVFAWIIYGTTALVIIDTIISVIKVKNIKVDLKKVEDISEEIKEKLNEIKEITKEKSTEKIKIKENLQNVVENLKRKQARMSRNLYRYVYRLKKAFPAINTKEITEILSKKISIKSNKDKK